MRYTHHVDTEYHPIIGRRLPDLGARCTNPGVIAQDVTGAEPAEYGIGQRRHGCRARHVGLLDHDPRDSPAKPPSQPRRELPGRRRRSRRGISSAKNARTMASPMPFAAAGDDAHLAGEVLHGSLSSVERNTGAKDPAVDDPTASSF